MAKKESLKVPESCDCWQEGDKRCRCCGASLAMPVHNLTRGLVGILQACAYTAREQGGYEIDPADVNLTHAQLCNLQRLRYFGLLVMTVKDGKRVPRHWTITRKGWQFLAGDIQVYKQMRSFRNRIVHWDETEAPEIPMVTIIDVMRSKSDPYWQQKADFVETAREYANPQERLL